MQTPTGSQLHYGCSFLLSGRSEQATWGSIAKTIRQWITSRVPNDKGLLGRWFFYGGSWTSASTRRLNVKSSRAICEGSEAEPQFWSVRFEHPCSEVPFRQWRTDIGITRRDHKQFEFALQTIYWILPDYIGDEPPPPLPSAPRIVSLFLQSNDWQGFDGVLPLTSTPRTVEVGKGKDFLSILEDRQRKCPVVFITRDYPDGDLALDPARVAQLLAGTASVFGAESSSVDKELEWLLPRNYRCWNGMVRVYQHSVRLDSDRDYRRHRYFSRQQIDELSPARVNELIVRAIARRSRVEAANDVVSLEHIDLRDREFRFSQLRTKPPDGGDRELLALYEEENGALSVRNRELMSTLESRQNRVDDLEDGNELLELKVDELQRRLAYVDQQSIRALGEKEELAHRLESIAELIGTLPDTVVSVVELIEKLFPTRVRFTARAKESAARASLADSGIAWRCLHSIATNLHGLFFDGDMSGGDIGTLFREATGFEMSLTEGTSTKADKKLMTLRRDLYEGQEIDITPHIKWGNKEPKLLRIHFCVDTDNRRIVIGHCGDHMDTSSTRKRT